jgi:hypothetical protein
MKKVWCEKCPLYAHDNEDGYWCGIGCDIEELKENGHKPTSDNCELIYIKTEGGNIYPIKRIEKK